jgi:ParB family chromosome partitioning protein
LFEIDGKAYTNYSYMRTISETSKDKLKEEVEAAVNDGAVGYYHSYSSTFYLMRNKDTTGERKKTQAELEREQAELERRTRTDKLRDAFDRAYKLRYDFVDTYTFSTAKANLNKIVAFFVSCGINDDLCTEINKDVFDKLVFGEPCVYSTLSELIDEIDTDCSAKALLVAVWLNVDSDGYHCFNYYGNYDESKPLEMIYEFLETIGYEMSDEEKELISGESELYLK